MVTIANPTQVIVPNFLPLPVYTQDEFHADPNRILSTVPASESSVLESAYPNRIANPTQVTVPNVLPLPVYIQDEFHADPNRILSTVPASESSVLESAHPYRDLGLHLDWPSRKHSLQCTVVPLRLGLEIFVLVLARQIS